MPKNLFDISELHEPTMICIENYYSSPNNSFLDDKIASSFSKIYDKRFLANKLLPEPY